MIEQEPGYEFHARRVRECQERAERAELKYERLRQAAHELVTLLSLMEGFSYTTAIAKAIEKLKQVL